MVDPGDTARDLQRPVPGSLPGTDRMFASLILSDLLTRRRHQAAAHESFWPSLTRKFVHRFGASPVIKCEYDPCGINGLESTNLARMTTVVVCSESMDSHKNGPPAVRIRA
jgi:hypothetical protein